MLRRTFPRITFIPTTGLVEQLLYVKDPAEAVAAGERIMAAGGLDVGGIEFLEAADGRLVSWAANTDRHSPRRSVPFLRKPIVPPSGTRFRETM